MASNDWYRNTEWNSRIRETFFARLARARSQRDQYLAIQALTLAPRFPKSALELVNVYFETRRSDFHDARALLAKAEAFRSMEEIPKAINAYKDVLVKEAELPHFKTRTCFDLPYLIATNGIVSEYGFALEILADGLDELAFPVDVFLWHAANALMAFDEGRRDEAAEHAIKAIEAAEVKKSGFRFHKNVGLIGKDHLDVTKRLAAIAA